MAGFDFPARVHAARVVGEGIENRKDLLALQEVDFGQGFLLGRPSTMPLQPR